MANNNASQASMVARIDRAMILLAYFIELDGDVHVPMYEKFEIELRDLKGKQDAKMRARQHLLSFTAWDQPQSGSIISPVCTSVASQCTGIPSWATE